jgi:hypothetical protein
VHRRQAPRVRRLPGGRNVARRHYGCPVEEPNLVHI